MQQKSNENKLTKRTVMAAALILLAIPLTIFFGVYVLHDRQYYLVSLLIIVYTMIPFFMVFEKRKPKPREIVVIAVLAAIAVAGRMAFFFLPQFKPVVAIVIIAGVCFGGEAGFLVGAVTGFVSNFYFGQGPWTPWQMFCFGVIGFLAGVLAQKGWMSTKPVPLAVFGGFATLFVYGGLINIGSLLMSTPHFTWQGLLAYYISALPMDLVHAASTVITLLLVSKPMMEKLERIKIKYGLIESEEPDWDCDF